MARGGCSRAPPCVTQHRALRAVADRQQLRMLRAGIDRERAARTEPATLGPGAGIRRLTLDRRQPPVAGDRRPGAARRAAAPRCRDGADRSAGPRGRPSSTTSPAYITSTREQIVGDHAQIVADQDHRGAEIGVQRAQQVEDLRLDRHVQRRGRFVGQDQRRARWRSPSPASRAGASRRRTGAARNRAPVPDRAMPMRPSSEAARVRAASRCEAADARSSSRSTGARCAAPG